MIKENIKENAKKNVRFNMEYRPERFKDVVGQENVITVFTRSIKENRVQNAYILEGDTGSGKTTTARIFANALICRNKEDDGEPCGKCISCQTFKTNPHLVDVIEIDAGEHRGIDKIRELKESLKFAPKEAYRIVMIDECHMLTKEGFTALLKPIEEPPERTIFLLLTNEPQKIMSTIRNRCIKLKFSPIAPHLIKERLEEICIKNNILCDEDILVKIAVYSKGIMRESISMLEQLSLMVGNEKITEEDLKTIANIEEKYIKELIYKILKEDVVGIMECIDKEDKSISEEDFDYMISRLRRYLYEKDMNIETSKLISQMINVFVEYKNKLLYNISSKTLMELSSIDCVSLCSDNKEASKYLLDNFSVQNKDGFLLALEQGKKDDLKEKIDNNVVKKEDISLVTKNKAELFMSLMNVAFEEFELKFKECSVEIKDDGILHFTLDSIEEKDEIKEFLKREYAQSLKPICGITGFITKAR